MLDEVAGRAIWITEPTTWGVTMDLNVKFRKIVPYDVKLKAVGKIIKNTKRGFVGDAKIYDMEGNILAEAEVTYIKLPIEKIANSDIHEDVNTYCPDDVTEIN